MVELISSVFSSVIGIRGGLSGGNDAPVHKPAPVDRDPATSEHAGNRILEAMLARFKKNGVPVREREVTGLHQVFIKDPNGITIELNFPTT